MNRILQLSVPVLLVWGSCGVSVAADLIHNKLEAYTVELASVTPAQCVAEQFDPGMQNEFDRGVCLFHNPLDHSRDELAIDNLQQAQLKGLPPVLQNFASLTTGLLHCRQAGRHLETFTASGNQSLLARDQFCRSRRQASASLGDVNWQYAYFDYEPASREGFSLDDRLDEMASCYAGVLDASFDAQCGLISTISDQEIDTFVAEATATVMSRYFEGVESPVSAMFARKVARAEGLTQSAQQGIAELKRQAEAVNNRHEAFDSVYQAAREEKLETIHSSYRTAVLKANSILDEFNRWKGGLFITAQNVNLLPKIQERKSEIDQELARVEGEQFVNKATELLSDIELLLQGDEANQRAVVQLCRIYYCEFANRRAMGELIQVCRRPSMQGNPLCVNADQSPRDGILQGHFSGPVEVPLQQFCQDSGMEPEFTATGLGPQASHACLALLP